MSQVIVENDEFKKRRVASADQELRIDCEGQFKRWRRNDITGVDPIAVLAALAAAPLLIIFWLFSKLSQVAIFVAMTVGRIVGAVVGQSK
jgi:hypothetical protein